MRSIQLAKKSVIFLVIYVLMSSVSGHGLDDIPVFIDAEVNTNATITASPDYEFTYQYSIVNGENNTGDIWSITLDVSTNKENYKTQAFPELNTAPLPRGSTRSMLEDAIDGAPYLGKLGSSVVPLGQRAPLGWAGGYSRDGTVSFSGLDPNAKILPDNSLAGFDVVSKHPPSLRDITLKALWFHISDSDDPSEEEWALVVEATEATRITSITLGPSPEPSLGTYPHWTNFVADVLRLSDINWITNADMTNTIEQEIIAAKAALDLKDGTLAKQRLEILRNFITNAPNGSLTPEATDLLLINIDLLIDKTPDTPTSFEPIFSITPEQAKLAVNDPYELVISVVNSADKNNPVEGFPILVECSFVSSIGTDNSCNSFGLRGKLNHFETDAAGEVKITIENPIPGKANFDVLVFGGEVVVGQPTITWEGGPDLVVPFFIPPLIQASAGDTISITERTMNQGNLASKSSVTRYYLSDITPIDIETAYIVGEQELAGLQPGELAPRFESTFIVPPELPEGIYSLKACADADENIVETYEDNNCSDIELATILYKAIPVVRNGETSSVSISDVSAIEGNFGESMFIFDVSLDYSDLLEDLTIDWQTVNGDAVATDDYESATGTLTFLANTSELTQEVSVTVYGDQLVEMDESFNVILSNPSELLSINKSQGTGVILNDDTDVSLMNCSNAFASPSKLWPPNHKFRTIHIEGISHLQGENFNVAVTNIFQDEHVNEVGDGHTEPDARLLGTNHPQVRSERSGLGDGRVYELSFIAQTDSGDNCEGVVLIGVPHNKHDTPIDSLIRYDSSITSPN